MDEKWKTYDIDLSLDEDRDSSVDASLTELSSLFDSDEMIPDWRGNIIKSVAESLPGAQSTECPQIFLSCKSLPATSVIAKAQPDYMSTITDSLKPLAAACQAATMKNMAVSAANFCNSFASVTAKSEAIHPEIVESAASMAGQLSNAVSEALSSSLCIQSAMQASVSPLPATLAVEKETTLSERYFEMIEATNALYEGVASVSDMYDSILSAASAAIQPVKAAAEIIVESHSIIFDISHVLKAISELIDSSSFIDELLDMSISSFVEMMEGLGKRSLSRLHEIAYFILHVLWGVWEKRPRLMAITCHNNVRLITSFVNIGLSPPEQVREYVVQIRHRYLQKHQRKSDNSEDMNDSILLLIS